MGNQREMEEMQRELREMKGKMEEMKNQRIMVGRGEYESDATTALLRHAIVIERRVASIEGVIYKNWKLRVPNAYLTKVKEMHRQFTDACIKAKGKKGERVGDCCNYTTLGILMTILADENLSAEDKAAVTTIVQATVGGTGDKQGKVDMEKVKDLFKVVSHCQVKALKEVAYLTYAVTREFLPLENILARAMANHGELMYEGPTPTPATRAMKETLVERGEWGKGAGKG